MCLSYNVTIVGSCAFHFSHMWEDCFQFDSTEHYTVLPSSSSANTRFLGEWDRAFLDMEELRDDPYWASMKNSSEVGEQSNKVSSMVLT